MREFQLRFARQDLWKSSLGFAKGGRMDTRRNNFFWRDTTIWLGIAAVVLTGCQRIRLPQIDPTGNRIFLPAPNTTDLLTPGLVRNSQQPKNNLPIQPSFTRPENPDSCCLSQTSQSRGKKQSIIPRPSRYPTAGQTGEILLTPSKIFAPVGSEVVVLAGICGNDSHFVMNQPLEWLLSSDSVGQIIEVGGQEHPTFNRLISPTAKKFDGNYAWGRTGLKYKLLTRGTPTPVDDIELQKGQAYVSVSSESPGTSYVTCVAPKAQAWDKRRKSTIIHWIDGTWAIPIPKSATAGTVTPLTTVVTRTASGNGISGWKVRYSIIGGAPAEFAPTGSQTVDVETNSDGQATVQLRQIAGKFDPGTTQIRVDVIRPSMFGEEALQVESGITSVTWSAPALTIRAIGPKNAGLDQAFNYRVEVTNPGDQITRGVTLQTKDLPENLEFISSSPKPTVFGRRLQWDLGDISPGKSAKTIDIQLKSNSKGNNELCFEVSSETDKLQTEACAQTEIVVPCLGLKIEGPDAGKVGDQARFNIKIKNQCDDPLENIALTIQYDNGLIATGLGNPIETTISQLAPDEERAIPIVFDIVSAGRLCYNLQVKADGGHSARATECIDAEPTTESAINLELAGKRRVNRNDKLLIRASATNNGNVPLDTVSLTNRFSDSLNPASVTQEFPHRWIGPNADELIFELGRLDPGQTKTVEIFYDALTVDGDAFSEVTLSSPDLSPVTKRYDLRIELPDTLGNDSSQLDNLDDGGQPSNRGPGNPPRIPNEESPIGIPSDDDSANLNAQQDLNISARTVERQISIGELSSVEFKVRNDSSISDKNIDISVLVPTSVQLDDVVDDLGTRYEIVSRSADFIRFDLKRRLEMRPGDELVVVVTVRGVQPGIATVELQATSENSAGFVTSSDTISIR